MFIFIAISIFVFVSIIITLTVALLFAEKKLISQENVELIINGTNTVKVSPGGTLLSVLAGENIFIPSACGGGGTCAMCRCEIESGGGDILPTEKAHINRRDEKKNIRLACQVKVRENMKIKVPDEIFSIKEYIGTVISNENVATFIKYLRVKIDNNETLAFQAGGYVQIKVPEGVYPFNKFNIEKEYRADWDHFNLWKYSTTVGENIIRAYSMANHPAEGNMVALTVRIATPPPRSINIQPGLCSSYIFSLNPGDKVYFSGPYGEFFIKETDNEKIYIGGGAGMAPMRSHLFHLFHTLKTKKKVSFFYGARSLKENFFEEDFNEIKENFNNFKYILALSDPLPEDNWTGPVGFIHQIVLDNYLNNHEDPTEIEYYLCGPGLMIDAVVRMLDDLGVDEDMIAFDKF